MITITLRENGIQLNNHSINDTCCAVTTIIYDLLKETIPNIKIIENSANENEHIILCTDYNQKNISLIHNTFKELAKIYRTEIKLLKLIK